VTILFTGGSSFTGYWFIKELHKSDHQIFATFRKNDVGEYESLKKIRISNLIQLCTPTFNCSFGDPQFIEFLDTLQHIDVLCHHAAEVADYKNPQFNFVQALQKNVNNVQIVFEKLSKKKCKCIILTGSVFEQHEGSGSQELRAFSPYGLSKGLTSDVIEYFSSVHKLKFGKFVIPNPFGPLEEPRFIHYLFKNWFANLTPVVNTPLYTRDNIHVTLLAKAYSRFVESLYNSVNTFLKLCPSGYQETMANFTRRLADETSKRTGMDCKFILNEQVDFSEPLTRINTDQMMNEFISWSESDAWDEYVDYYKNCSFG